MGLGRLHRDSRVPRSLGEGKKSSELSSVVYLENEHEKVGLSPATECVLFVAVTPRSFSLLTQNTVSLESFEMLLFIVEKLVSLKNAHEFCVIIPLVG